MSLQLACRGRRPQRPEVGEGNVITQIKTRRGRFLHLHGLNQTINFCIAGCRGRHPLQGKIYSTVSEKGSIGTFISTLRDVEDAIPYKVKFMAQSQRKVLSELSFPHYGMSRTPSPTK